MVSATSQALDREYVRLLWNMTKAMNVLYSVRVLQSLYRFQPYDCVIIRFVE